MEYITKTAKELAIDKNINKEIWVKAIITGNDETKSPLYIQIGQSDVYLKENEECRIDLIEKRFSEIPDISLKTKVRVKMIADSVEGDDTERIVEDLAGNINWKDWHILSYTILD